MSIFKNLKYFKTSRLISTNNLYKLPYSKENGCHFQTKNLFSTYSFDLQRKTGYSFLKSDRAKNDSLKEENTSEEFLNNGDSNVEPEPSPTFPWLYGNEPPRLPGPLLLETFPNTGPFGIVSSLYRKFITYYSKSAAESFFKKGYFQNDFVFGAEIALKNLTKSLSTHDYKKLELITTKDLYSNLVDKLHDFVDEELDIKIEHNHDTVAKEFVFIFGPPDLMSFSNKEFFPTFLKNLILPTYRENKPSQNFSRTVFASATQGLYLEVFVEFQVDVHIKRKKSSEIIADHHETRTHWLTFTSSYLENVNEIEKSIENISWKIADVDFLVASELKDQYMKQVELAHRIPTSDSDN